jgi:hypothetical protein
MGALRDFVSEFLEREGAAVEPVEPDGLDVLAPAPLRAAFGWPDFLRLGFGATLAPGTVRIGLESDWLDRFGELIGERGRCAERQLAVSDAATAPSDPERMLDRAFDLPNAAWRLRGTAPAWTACLLLAFRYTATSDEKREGLVWFGLNLGTGAGLDGDLLGKLRAHLGRETDWHAPAPQIRAAAVAGLDMAKLAARLLPLVDHRVRHDLASFLHVMRRRLDRDRGRIYDYHDGLRRVAQRKLAALATAAGDKAEADRKREALRIAAIEREYAAKLEDLRHHYALRATVDWVQTLMLFAPVQRYDVLIKRRKGERFIRIDWHPAVRMIEPPPCDWGAGAGRTRLVCDDRLHLTDPEGQAPCASCGKTWCRACYPAACPRCRRLETEPVTSRGGLPR